jgi:hypothetical protein
MTTTTSQSPRHLRRSKTREQMLEVLREIDQTMPSPNQRMYLTNRTLLEYLEDTRGIELTIQSISARVQSLAHAGMISVGYSMTSSGHAARWIQMIPSEPATDSQEAPDGERGSEGPDGPGEGV